MVGLTQDPSEHVWVGSEFTFLFLGFWGYLFLYACAQGSLMGLLQVPCAMSSKE